MSTSVPAAYGKLIREGNCSTQQAAQHSKQNQWIWEYMLKNCDDFRITALLMETMPIPDTPLMKTLTLLKLISLDIAAGSISERDLSALQGLEDLIREERRRSPSSDEQENGLEALLPNLQLLVKKELVLQHLRDGKDNWENFNDALERYWGEAVQDTEEPEKLDSEFAQAKNELRNDLWSLKGNHRFKRYVLQEHQRENVETTIKDFLNVAWETIGPIFLEKAEEDVVSGRYVPVGAKRTIDSDSAQKTSKKIRKTLLPSLDDDAAVKPAHSDDDSGSPRIKLPPWSAGEPDRHETRKLRRRYVDDSDQEARGSLQTPNVEKALHELKASQSHLRQQVNDPLPAAIEVAKKLKGLHKQDDERLQTSAQPDSNAKLSVMDRQPTARTCQWNEDEDEIDEDSSPSASKRLNLPSTSTKKVSPLRKAESSHRRRKFRRWTAAEEEALRKGVERYGKGCWKAILQGNLDIFENRTEVDLKDKWRNIERAEGIRRDS